MAVTRRAEVGWDGDLMSGSGMIRYVSSGSLSRLPVTWASRTEAHEGRTSPEELIAAAHAACFCMGLSATLGENGTPPDRLEVSATVTFAQVEGGFKVGSSALTVRGTVPGLDADGFREAAHAAKDGCPVSGALKGNVEITVSAELV
jgi:osmotically inducible protein OsmC